MGKNIKLLLLLGVLIGINIINNKAYARTDDKYFIDFISESTGEWEIDGKDIDDFVNSRDNCFKDGDFYFVKNDDDSCGVYAHINSLLGEVSIPATAKKGSEVYTVTNIWDRCFYGNDTITKIELPYSITDISYAAFGNMENLTDIYIPANVINIEGNVFSGCTKLTNIFISKDNKNYSVDVNGNIYNNDKTVLLSVSPTAPVIIIPENVLSIDEDAFDIDNIQIEKIVVPDSIKELPAGLFEGLKNLREISLPDDMMIISDNLFNGCEKLATIKFPEKLQKIGYCAFEGCSSIETLEFPNNLEDIRDKAFAYCNGLKIIVFNEGLKSIGSEWNSSFDSGSFYGCDRLETILFPESLDYIGVQTFEYCNSLNDVVLPASLKTLDWHSFANCRKLNKITILSMDVDIHEYAFIDSCLEFTISGYTGSTAQKFVEDNSGSGDWSCHFYALDAPNSNLEELVIDPAPQYIQKNEKSEKTVVEDHNVKISINVTGRYKDGQLKKVFTDTELYTDYYFTNNSTDVQGGLAKLSMLAASSAYSKSYAEKLMSDCQFTTHHYEKKKNNEKTNDTISYELGIRKVEDITIIAVWVKGTSGDYEWVSNWNLGKGNVHTGFNKAEKTMKAEINKYLESNGIVLSNSGKIKIWITGHSRGAAVANLYAKDMNDKIGSANVYAYTFATPRVSKIGKKNRYNNIFNYLNPGDFVTEVAPEKWGYKRYGVDITLSKSKKNGMMKTFKKVSGMKYAGFGEGGKKSLVKAFIAYAGNSNTFYYKKKLGYSPAFFVKMVWV